MISYVTLGSNDIEKAKAFYTPIIEMMGAQPVFDTEQFITWGVGEGKPMFAIIKPFDGQEATSGNGTMVTFSASSKDAVNQLHAKALALGAKNEGDPGARSETMYCAYCRDLDGNKLNFFCPNT